MLNELLKTVVHRSNRATENGANGPVVLTSTGDKYVVTAIAPMRLLKWGFMIDDTALDTTSAALILDLDKRITAGSDTGRVADIDTLTVAVTNQAYTLGKGAYRDGFTTSTKSTTQDQPSNSGPVGGNAPDQENGQGQFTLKAGEQWVIDVRQGAGTAGKGKLFIEAVLLPISKPSGYGTTDAGTVSLTENYTRLAS